MKNQSSIWIRRGSWIAWIGLPGLLACGGTTPGARPHDMSEAQHEAMASREDAATASHAAQYDPAATEDRTRCRSRAGRGGGNICWTSLENPTAEHLRDAEVHRKRAADHRAAAQALRDAEARACAGIDPDDRDISPFYHREDIVRVEPPPANWAGTGPRDVTVIFRAVPGATPHGLLHVIDCHIARNAVVGPSDHDMPYCPLVLKGVKAMVEATEGGFAVTIRSDDPAVAAEVRRRVEGLVARGAHVP